MNTFTTATWTQKHRFAEKKKDIARSYEEHLRRAHTDQEDELVPTGNKRGAGSRR